MVGKREAKVSKLNGLKDDGSGLEAGLEEEGDGDGYANGTPASSGNIGVWLK